MTRFSIMNSDSLSHRIEPSAMQRMASEYARAGANDSPTETILFDGFLSIFRAGRREPASRREPRRDNELVGSHHFYCESLKDGQTHFPAPRRLINSARTCWNSKSPAERRGFTTKSNPAGIDGRDVRRISLTLLLTRFRSCAFPNFRDVVSPKRL